MVALCQRGFSRLGETLERANARSGLKGMTNAYLKFSKENSTIYQLMFSDDATADQGEALLREYAAPVFELLESVLRENISGTEEDETVLTSIAVWYFMHGAASLSSIPPLRARLGKTSLNKFAYDVVMKMLQGDPENK